MSQVAVIQMVSGHNPDENLTQAQIWIKRAAEQGAQLVVLPENFIAYGNPDYLKIGQQEQHNQGPILEQLKDLAKANTVWIITGTVPVCDQDSRPMARSWVIGSEGQLIGWYDKIHLFDALVADEQRMYRESSHYCPGDGVYVVQTPFGRIGMAICYDLRFPELFARLRHLGCELLVLPSAFTYVTGSAHWQTLIQARAIENACYVLAANQGGEHPGGRRTWGQSMIVDPWGQILNQHVQGEGLVMAGVDLNTLQKYRSQIPVSQHRLNRVLAL